MPVTPKKIICTVTNDLSYDQRMIRICTSLAKAGHQVTLVGRQLPASVPIKQEVFRQVRLKCLFHKGKLFYLEFNLRLCWWLLGQDFDLVCGVDLDTLGAAFLTAGIKKKTCIYDAHEYFTELPEVVDRPFTRWVWSSLARLVIPRLRYAYTVGPELARVLEDRYGIPFATIRNLPLQQREQIDATTAREQKVILYQGRLNVGRGLQAAILAMHHLEGAQLWLAGEGDLSDELRQLAAREGLDHKVRFLGYVSPDALRDITLQADIGINLLAEMGLNYYYSLANKAFDYIQAGVPSVQMDFPEYRALQEQHQVFVLLETLEVPALVEKLQQLLTNGDYWRQLHFNCLAARKELCWEKEERKLLELYKDIAV